MAYRIGGAQTLTLSARNYTATRFPLDADRSRVQRRDNPLWRSDHNQLLVIPRHVICPYARSGMQGALSGQRVAPWLTDP